MYFIYSISSLERNYIYVDLTDNFNRRFIQHNNGIERTTRPYRPFLTMLVEEFEKRKNSQKRHRKRVSSQNKRRKFPCLNDEKQLSQAPFYSKQFSISFILPIFAARFEKRDLA
ncbi:MAG: GIY-YIG nuclease family protein [Flavobacteriales bacterium]